MNFDLDKLITLAATAGPFGTVAATIAAVYFARRSERLENKLYDQTVSGIAALKDVHGTLMLISKSIERRRRSPSRKGRR